MILQIQELRHISTSEMPGEVKNDQVPFVVIR